MRIPSLFGRPRDDAPGIHSAHFDPRGTIYAVGDVHGKLTLLKGLVARIRNDIERSETPEQKTIVFLGDYVDRGEDSRGVLEFLADFQQQFAFEHPECGLVFLRGNHEQQMLDFIDSPVRERRWLGWGGEETMQSFGIPPIFPTAPDEDYIDAAAAFAEKLGDLRDFIETQTVLWHGSGNVIFTHGGMDPSLPVDRQLAKTMLWGNDDFMQIGGPPGYWHVHGHVIHPQPGIYGNRIAVDTGAYKTGRLTVVRITDQGPAFMQQS